MIDDPWWWQQTVSDNNNGNSNTTSSSCSTFDVLQSICRTRSDALNHGNETADEVQTAGQYRSPIRLS